MEKGAAKQAMQKAKEKHVQGPMEKGMEKVWNKWLNNLWKRHEETHKDSPASL